MMMMISTSLEGLRLLVCGLERIAESITNDLGLRAFLLWWITQKLSNLYALVFGLLHTKIRKAFIAISKYISKLTFLLALPGLDYWSSTDEDERVLWPGLLLNGNHFDDQVPAIPSIFYRKKPRLSLKVVNILIDDISAWKFTWRWRMSTSTSLNGARRSTAARWRRAFSRTSSSRSRPRTGTALQPLATSVSTPSPVLTSRFKSPRTGSSPTASSSPRPSPGATSSPWWRPTAAGRRAAQCWWPSLSSPAAGLSGKVSLRLFSNKKDCQQHSTLIWDLICFLPQGFVNINFWCFQ